MSASSIDSREAMPQDEPRASDTDKPDLRSSGKAGKSPAKPRTKRPRPTFDDGALTRVFKFPSKSYPRSSYYVTADEIIIRIKKARKRWKLIVPKKRLVSYKTNRWFTKPRWVEIELTYTQALKLKLVEPKSTAPAQPAELVATAPAAEENLAPAQAKLVAAETMSEQPPLLHDQQPAQIEAEAQDSAETDENESDGTDEAMSISEEDSVEDPTEVWDEAPAEDATPEDTEPLAAAESASKSENRVETAAIEEQQPSQQEVVASAPEQTAQSESVFEPQGDPVPAPEPEPEPVSGVTAVTAAPASPAPSEEVPALAIRDQTPIRLPETAAAAAPPDREPKLRAPLPVPPQAQVRRFDARLWASTLMVAAAATSWVAYEEWRAAESVAPIACTASNRGPACAEPIITGSLPTPVEVQSPVAPQIEVARERVIEPVDSPPPQVTPVKPTPAPHPEQAREETAPAFSIAPQPPAVTLAAEPSPPPAIAEPPAPAPAPIVIAAAREPLRREEPAATLDSCRELKHARAPLAIQFDFASSSLDRIAIASLESVASLLIKCTSASVSIEGHTSSDGDAERNHALSVRRANEVKAHLAGVGLNTNRLTAVGFGPSRPQAPNTTPENKRANRRVELKISVPN